MVEAINYIAEGIGLKTIAEFVENQTILDTVRELKIDYAQGFHLGRPTVLTEVISEVDSQQSQKIEYHTNNLERRFSNQKLINNQG